MSLQHSPPPKPTKSTPTQPRDSKGKFVERGAGNAQGEESSMADRSRPPAGTTTPREGTRDTPTDQDNPPPTIKEEHHEEFDPDRLKRDLKEIEENPEISSDE